MSEQPNVLMYIRCIPRLHQTALWHEVDPVHIPRAGEYVSVVEGDAVVKYVVRDVVWFYRKGNVTEVTVFVEKHYI